MPADTNVVTDLLYQALATERGGQLVYTAAIENATTPELQEEWQGYLDETRNHEQVLLGVFETFGLDPSKQTNSTLILDAKAKALVQSMKDAKAKLEPSAAELVAAECVVEAETKDHQNWELIGKLAESMSGEKATALRQAHEEVEEQEDEHLYHTMGWARELWLQHLGLPAVVPPPEEQKSVKTAIGAARAKNAREEMLSDQKKG